MKSGLSLDVREIQQQRLTLLNIACAYLPSCWWISTTRKTGSHNTRACHAHSQVFLFVRVRVERGLSCVFHGVYSGKNTKHGLGGRVVLKHFFIDLCSHLCESFCVSRAPQLHNIVPRWRMSNEEWKTNPIEYPLTGNTDTVDSKSPGSKLHKSTTEQKIIRPEDQLWPRKIWNSLSLFLV